MAQTVGQITVDLDAKVAKFNENIAKARNSLEQAGQRMNKSLTAIDKGFAIVARGAATLVGALGVAALAQFGRQALDTIGGLGELAQQMGVTTDTLQTLQFAALETGNSLEEIQSAIQRFSKTVGEAAEGNEKAIETFDKLGIKILNAAGNLRPTDELLREFADRIAGIEDPALRAVAVTDLMGKGGQKLLPILEAGGQGFDDFGKRARDAGYLVDSELIAASDKAGDAIAVFVEVTRRRLQSLFASEVLPGLQAIAEAIANIGRSAISATGGAAELQKLTAEVERLVAIRDRLVAEAGPNVGPKGIAAGQIADLNRRIADLNAQRAALLKIANPQPEGATSTDAGSAGASNSLSEKARKDIEAADKIINAYLIKQQTAAADFGDAIAQRQRAIFEALAKLPEGATEDQRTKVALLAAEEFDRTEGVKLLTEELKKLDTQERELADAYDQTYEVQLRQGASRNALIEGMQQEESNNRRLIAALDIGLDAYEQQKAIIETLNALKAAGIPLDSETAANALAIAENLGKQRKQLNDNEDALREQRALWARLADTIGSNLEDAFVRGAKASEVLRAALADVLRILIQIGSSKLGAGQVSGGSSGGGLLGGLLGGALDGVINNIFGGGGASAGSLAGSALVPGPGGGLFPALAEGGSFRVGPGSGTDRTFFGAWVSPGENIHVMPPGEDMGGGGGMVAYIDARGATEDAIKGIRRELRILNASVEPRAVAAVTDARRRGRGGLAEHFG